MAESSGYLGGFFRTNELTHCVSGLWLFKVEGLSKKQKFFQYLWSVVMYASAVGFIFLEFMMFKETSKDVIKLISQFGLLLSTVLSIMKLYIIYTLVGVTAHISSEISINLEVKGNNFETNSTCYDFVPYYFYIPFPSDTKRKCELVFVFMDFSLCALAWNIGCHDAFYAALLNCLKTQLLILSGAVKTIRQRVLKRLGLPVNLQTFRDEQLPRLEQELYKELKRVTEHLIVLLRVADELEAIFNLVTLGQAVISFVAFASCLFVTASIPVASPEFFTQLEYLLCLLLELGLYCWFGNGVTVVSEELMFSLYDCDWFSSSERFKSTLVTTMTRMQRPICLTFGKFYPLTINALVSICKGSFSYYTLFKSIND